MIHILDLHFKDLDHSIASFLIETSDGPVLVETGPYSTFHSMEKELAKHGYEVSDIKNVLLTHIHFDHAGAAWAFAKAGANIYLHPFGAPHMEDPTKLYNSAKQIYGDDMERLWGAMEKIPNKQLIEVAHGETLTFGDTTITGWHTPGHAKHHIAWQMDGIIFTGDVGGVKIENSPVVPPCPPPDINLEDWEESIKLLLDKNAEMLYLTHYGQVTNIEEHFENLRSIIKDWAYWIKERWEQGLSTEEMTNAFSEYTNNQLRNAGVSAHGIEQHNAANPSYMSVLGLIRYWKKKSQS